MIKPIDGQVNDLLEEIRSTIERKERVLVTTFTKGIIDYQADAGVRLRYLNSDIDALERVRILRAPRLADFDVLLVINQLRGRRWWRSSMRVEGRISMRAAECRSSASAGAPSAALATARTSP